MATKPARSARRTPSRFKTASPPLTRGEIIDAALREAEAGELEQLTVRKLADELDVTPMALYRHVRDKDEILEGVTDALLAQAGLPDPDIGWERYLTDLAASLRAVLRDHPTVVAVFTRRAVVTPAALARLSGAEVVLTRAGFDHAKARRMYAAVHTYTVGFCALEAGRHIGKDDAVGTGDDAVTAGVAAFVSEEQFRFGLEALVQGLSHAD